MCCLSKRDESNRTTVAHDSSWFRTQYSQGSQKLWGTNMRYALLLNKKQDARWVQIFSVPLYRCSVQQIVFKLLANQTEISVPLLLINRKVRQVLPGSDDTLWNLRNDLQKNLHIYGTSLQCQYNQMKVVRSVIPGSQSHC